MENLKRRDWQSIFPVMATMTKFYRTTFWWTYGAVILKVSIMHLIDVQTSLRTFDVETSSLISSDKSACVRRSAVLSIAPSKFQSEIF